MFKMKEKWTKGLDKKAMKTVVKCSRYRVRKFVSSAAPPTGAKKARADFKRTRIGPRAGGL